ncbi:MAG: hypothetical protein KDK66_06045 [Deltaproteobacteria bacterium]|nr:hypothetical protein [Deltaproteobacteria bacterium]
MKKNKLVSVVFLLLFLSCSCSDEKNNKIYKDEFTIATDVPIGEVSFDATSGIGANLKDLLFYPLFFVEEDGSYQSPLAKNIELLNEGKTLSIELKDNNAEEVKNSILKLVSSNVYNFKVSFKNFLGVFVMAPNKLKIEFKRYDRLLIQQLGSVNISKGQERSSTGEFELYKQEEDSVILKRKKLSQSEINYIKVKLIPSYRLAIREFVSGSIDLLLYTSANDYDIISDLPEYSFDILKGDTLFVLVENQLRNKFKKSIDWLKLNEVMDRKKLVSIYGSLISEEAFVPVKKSSIWYDPSWDSIKFKKSNFSDSLKNTLSNNSHRELSFIADQIVYELLGRQIKRWAQEIGVDLRLKPVDLNSYYTSILEKHEYDLLILPLNFDNPFLSTYLNFRSRSLEDKKSTFNIDYENKKVDELLDKARYERSFKDSKAYFVEAVNLILKEPPGAFLFWSNIPIVYRKGCSNLEFDSPNNFFLSLEKVSCLVSKN